MKRKAYDKLLEWKNSAGRRPLILYGARQVGKTWLLKAFGEKEYESTVYINCDNNPDVENLFFDFDTERIIRVISAITNKKIEKEKTLIIFDEIQEEIKGITALKYFNENNPDYHIAVAGSLLGLKVHSGTGFPVGKVDEITLYPMTFTEFLEALGHDMLLELLESERWNEISALGSRFIELLRQYYYCGGMPEVVKNYVEKQDLKEVRSTQLRILRDYKRDFSKHIPARLLPKVNMVWDGLSGQLAKENKKFIYSAIKKGGRAKEFEDAIQWLIEAGLVHKVNRIKKIDMPLNFYEDISAFKLFSSDLGLLGAKSSVPAKDILSGSNIFKEYKGSFTEQYVAQQMIASGVEPYYYSNENSTMEIDFVIQMDKVYPIEVKAEENLKSKSLQTVLKDKTDMKGWRFSMSPYREQERIVNVPLYAVSEWIKSRESGHWII